MPRYRSVAPTESVYTEDTISYQSGKPAKTGAQGTLRSHLKVTGWNALIMHPLEGIRAYAVLHQLVGVT